MHLEKQSSGSLNFGLKNITVTFLVWVVIAFLAFLDGYLKCHPDETSNVTLLEVFQRCVNFRLFFHLSCLVLPFTLWSFLIKFCCTRQNSRDVINYVECLNHTSPPLIGRAESKLNLHAIILDSRRILKQQDLFDFFWYERRTAMQVRNRTKKEEVQAQKSLAKRVEFEEMKLIKNAGQPSIFAKNDQKPAEETPQHNSIATAHLDTISMSPLKGADIMDSNSKGSYFKNLECSPSPSKSLVNNQQSSETDQKKVSSNEPGDQFSMFSLGSRQTKQVKINNSVVLIESIKESTEHKEIEILNESILDN